MHGVHPDTILQVLDEHFALGGELCELPGYVDQNFRLTTGGGEEFVVKVMSIDGPTLVAQNEVLTGLADRGFPVPRVVPNRSGESVTKVLTEAGEARSLRVLTFLQGRFYADVAADNQGEALWRDFGRLLGGMDVALQDFDYPSAGAIHRWDLAHGYIVCTGLVEHLGGDQAALVGHFLEYYRLNVLPLLGKLPRSLIHNDANDYNVLVDDVQEPDRISGLIDFGDLSYTHTVNELAIAAAYVLMRHDDPVEVLTHFAAGYHAERPLGDAEIAALYGLVALRLCTSVCNSTADLVKRPDNEYLQISAKPAWDLLKKLRDLEPYAVECRLREACGLPTDTGRGKEAIIAARSRHLGRNLSLSFSEPLKIVRGAGTYLYDEYGNEYLDMVNNVCHVGHCHPRVVAAGAAQMAKLNTNTRFLHDHLVDYTERLLATLPDELSVAMFVNSGSEANELALRLAKTYTGSRELLVVDGAYHGNTNACVDASPYKFDGPGGEGAPDHVSKVLLPDTYRGSFRGTGDDVVRGYAADVERALNELKGEGRKPGAFICESLQGVAGQIIMPDGYLQAVYPMVRDAGGVCIADEVQVGFGRVGSHMWAFETQGVVPDIVTLGKPIGNGHPMAAVITTPEIADAFATGMEFFSTFGGNPVSCAIGMAVLDVIRDEGLQQNALETGNYLVQQLRDLQQEFELIGDVRGLGLFIGVELVTDRDTLEPATRQTADLIEFLKTERIILSCEGPHHNVLKIKPPIVFSRDDADRFLKAIRAGLGRDLPPVTNDGSRR